MLTRFVGGALSLLFILSPAAAGKGGKKGGKKQMPMPPMEDPTLHCVPEEYGFQYYPRLAEPWVYPKPRLFMGFQLPFIYELITGITPDPYLPQGGFAVPLSIEDAMAAGWYFDEGSCKWISDTVTQMAFSYMDGSLFGVELMFESVNKVYRLDYFGGFYSSNSLEVLFNDGTSNDFAVVSKRATQNEVIPMSWSEAEVSGYWARLGSCNPAMGGYHAIPNPTPWDNPYTPIYDTLNTGLMKAIVLTGGAFPPEKYFTQEGFDGYGAAVTVSFAADFQFCDLEEESTGAYDDLYEKTGGSTDANDLFGLYAATTHMLWDVDPSDPTTWGTCLCPLEDGYCCDAVNKTSIRDNVVDYPLWYVYPSHKDQK